MMMMNTTLLPAGTRVCHAGPLKGTDTHYYLRGGPENYQRDIILVNM